MVLYLPVNRFRLLMIDMGKIFALNLNFPQSGSNNRAQNSRYFRSISCLASFCIFLCGLCGCHQQEQDSDQDPLCESCIERACQSKNADFENHLKSQPFEEQAQIINQMEAFAGCLARYPDLKPTTEKVYENYGASLYDLDQPWLEDRGRHAFGDMIKSKQNRSFAKNYLIHYLDKWQGADWSKEAIQDLEPYMDLSNDIFDFLAKVADKDLLKSISKLEMTPNRESALIFRWQDLPDHVQQKVLHNWVSAKWTMQTSGSSQLAQYLTLDWKKRPLPEGVPDFIATLSVDKIRINNREVKRRDWVAKDSVHWSSLNAPGLKHHRFDLQPWLKTADNYRVSASAKIDIWPLNASQDCLNQTPECQEKPIVSIPEEFDRQYRVFVGVETGAPKRHKDDADNKKASESLHLEICSDENCMVLWDGSIQKQRETLTVFQGHDFYLKSTSDNTQLPLSARLMAKQTDSNNWREIAAFFSYEPQLYEVPVRADIDLGDLCNHTGPCRLDLQLRPSLRFARRDPRIVRYWGSTLELGVIHLDLQNQSARQIWSTIHP